MTRRRRCNALQRVLHVRATIEALEIFGQREQRPRAVVRVEQRRHRVHSDRRVAERFELEPEPRELGRAAHERLVRRRRDVEHHRHEQPLRLERAGRQALHHALEQHALVRDMLIDDRNPLVVHGDDERVAELAEGNHRLDIDRRSHCRGRRDRRERLALRVLRAPRLLFRMANPPVRVRAAREDSRERRRVRRGRRRRVGDGLQAVPRRRVFGPELQLRRAALAERLHERAAHHLVHERLLAEADFRLRGVHVHVERVGRHLDEEVHLGAALLDRRLAVGIDDRVRDRTVLDDPAVDEDVLRSARRSLIGERGDETRQLQAARLLLQVDQIVALAVHLIQTIARGERRRNLQHGAARARERESDLGIRERELRDDARDLRGLGAIGLQELPPRRQVVEEIVDLDDRAFRRRRFDDAGDGAAVDADLGAALPSARARTQQEMRHRRDRRQRLAAEAEREDRGEIVGAADLARRMPLDREPRILRLHPFPIVLDADLFLAAELDVDRNPPRAGVDRVLHQLLDDGRRALDDFAGGDLVRKVRREAVDLCHARNQELKGIWN